ncbi:hypothetical protein [Granulicatella balaenopterae]|nr:hypothetical protein [Granulicatella balaenopterae]
MSRVIVAMICCCLLFMGISVRAETTGNVPVTYTKETSVTYPLHVKVTGKGEVSTATETLRNQTKQYDLAVDESMTFHLKADTGRKVKKVLLNGSNVEASIADNKLTVSGAEKEQTLIVEFESARKIFPQTGDSSNLVFWCILFVLSLAGIIYTYRKKIKLIKN